MRLQMSSTRSQDTRRRLLEAATQIFADKGFTRSSTREIAAKAGANIASLNYHFDDKAGLYRSVFDQHFNEAEAALESIDLAKSSFEVIYGEFNRQFFAAFAGKAIARLMNRELIEPTGLLGEEWGWQMRRRHDALVFSLCRELGLEAPDDEVQRLTLALVGMVVIFERPLPQQFAPGILDQPDWIGTILDQVQLYARAVIQAEKARRHAAPQDPTHPEDARGPQ